MAFTPDSAYDLIKRAWDHGRLAHAFLIYGEDQADMQTLAARMGALVNGWTNVKTLDDLRQKGAVIVEPSGKLRRIKVDDMREADRTLHYTSDSHYKLCVIADADRLAVESGNAFLKTLEEPPDNTLILLLTTAPEQLLDTIRSRSVRVPLFRPTTGGKHLNPAQAELAEMLALWFQTGAPSFTRAAALQSDFQSLLERIRASIVEENDEALEHEKEIYGKTTDGVWLKERADYYDDLTETLYNGQRQHLLGVLFTWMGEILRRTAGLPATDLPQYATISEQAARNFSQADLQRRIQAIEELRSNLATNVREALALEVGFSKAFA